MSTTATVKLLFFRYNEDGPNFSVLEDIDTDMIYINKSDSIPEAVDYESGYDTSLEFDINYDVIGQNEYKGKLNTEISIGDATIDRRTATTFHPWGSF